jgi:hypothetical protein
MKDVWIDQINKWDPRIGKSKGETKERTKIESLLSLARSPIYVHE